jgi:hypothetical protein
MYQIGDRMKLTINYTHIRIASDPDYGAMSDEEFRAIFQGELIDVSPGVNEYFLQNRFGVKVEPGSYYTTYNERWKTWEFRLPNNTELMVGGAYNREFKDLVKQGFIKPYNSDVDWRPTEITPEDFYA